MTEQQKPLPTIFCEEPKNEAIVVFEETIKKFGDTRHLLICESVVQSLFNKGVVLTQLLRLDESITVYDEVVKKYGDYVESVICELIARSLFNKGLIFSKLQRGDEFMDVYDELYNRFGENTEPAIRECVTRGLEIKSHALLMIAKQCWESQTEMQTWLAEASVIFKKNHDRCNGNDLAKNLAKQAYTAHLLNDSESYVRKLMHEALRLGGLNVYQAMLSDLAQIPIPPDSQMRFLLDDVWRDVVVAGV
jgi:tetratricopeptide (TPR) repeat protein